MTKTLCLSLLLASSLPAFADHNDHPVPGAGIRCTTGAFSRWYGVRDLGPADARALKAEVIAMCQQGRAVSDVDCAIHAACSTEPLTAFVCSANTTSDPGRVHAAWAASAETVEHARLQVVNECIAHAYTLRDRLRCENTARTCQPATRADLESEPVVAAPLPPPVMQMACSAQAFGMPASSDAFVATGDLVTINRHKDQAILRCVENFRLDSPGRRMVAERECRETAACRTL